MLVTAAVCFGSKIKAAGLSWILMPNKPFCCMGFDGGINATVQRRATLLGYGSDINPDGTTWSTRITPSAFIRPTITQIKPPNLTSLSGALR